MSTERRPETGSRSRPESRPDSPPAVPPAMDTAPASAWPEIWMLHYVEAPPSDVPTRHPDSWIPPDDLATQLDRLQAWGYRTLRLGDAVRAVRSGRLPERSVVLTFDDACTSILDHALPLLVERRMTATVFAVAGALGGTNHWDEAEGEPRRRLMDAAQLERLAAADLEVGCHGGRHVALTGLAPEALEAETAGARARLEDALGREVRSFCYPYGAVDRAAREAVRAAGFDAAVSIVDHGIARRGDPWALPRWPLRPGTGRLELWLQASGHYRWWRRLPRLGLLRFLRRLGGGKDRR